MKKIIPVLLAVISAGVISAAEFIPEKFFTLKIGTTAGSEIAEPEPGKISIKMVSGEKAHGNYVCICHNRNTPVKAGTILTYKVTPAENYANGTHFTPAVAYVKPGEKKWNGQNGKGMWLHKEYTASFDLVKDLKIPEGSSLRQIKFVLNAGKNPQGKEVKVLVSDLKLIAPDAK